MISKLGFKALRVLRSIWFRPALYAFAAAAILALTPVLEPLIPDDWADLIGDGAVKDILDILAGTMLAVAIFSLSTMVAAFQMATGQATPRARALVTRDPVAQNAIATFIGAFLFSMVGIIGLAGQYYSDAGRFILLVFSVILIIVVVATLISWIMRLSSLGGVGEAADRLEEATRDGFLAYRRLLSLGRAVDGPPESFTDVPAQAIGYVQHVDGETLGGHAQKWGVEICILALPGAYAGTATPLASSSRPLSEAEADCVRACFIVGGDRTFELDPRFGLIVLAEIAQRALSPAVNDPGTAIDIIGTSVRALAECPVGEPSEEARCAGLLIADFNAEDFVIDAFRVIGRDGAGLLEVAIRLQKGLGLLAREKPDVFADACRAMADEAFERSKAAMTLDADIEALRTARREAFGA